MRAITLLSCQVKFCPFTSAVKEQKEGHPAHQEIPSPTTFISTALPRKDSLRQPRLQFHLVSWIDDIFEIQKIRPEQRSTFSCDIKGTKQGTRDPYVLNEADRGPVCPCLRTVSITQLAGRLGQARQPKMQTIHLQR